MSGEPEDHKEFEARLKAYEGRPAAATGVGRDLVNEPMIRHWCEAISDTNPAYTGPDTVAPPTMLQAWTMAGLTGRPERTAAYEELLCLLDESGHHAVVATDCEQEYLRPLRPGDEITFDSVIESVSGRKTTKLGAGYFVTTRTDIRAGGELAGIHRFRILKYAPARTYAPARKEAPTRTYAPARKEAPTRTYAPARKEAPTRTYASAPKEAPAAEYTPASRPASPEERRPRPVINRDNAGFWEGVAGRELLIQRCAGCGTPRFPWLPGCNRCGCARWDTLVASGDGTVYSYVVVHHPPFPAFEPPYAVGLIELAEGVRIVSNVVGVPYDKVRIGMPVRLEFRRYDDELVLPVFRGVTR